ncbi:glycosyltransferase [Actinomadura rugatobispora]|uniref:Glycosyltransferase n=1 Tax=Actinomadura rugatobispora TaxID=1994 RepID=A0ABW1A482_9ACTN|nr:glycosyltransferase family 1 protein [Actinomadura rugatobispora]
MQRPLNIALVSASDLDGEHVQAIHTRELARALARPASDDSTGHQVTLYTRRHDAAARARVRLGPGASVQQIDAGPARPLDDDQLLQHVRDFAEGLRDRWRGTGRPDLVHAHGWIGGLAACAVARELGIPFVVSPHGLGAAERQAGRRVHPARARLEKAIGREAAAVVTACADEAATLVRMGVPRRTITMVPYGVDGDQFSQIGPAMPHGARDRLVTVAHDLEGGGVATAIRALVHVPGAELAVAGGPPREELENDAAVHRLRLLAKELHVEDRVIFLGRVPRKSLPRLLRTAKLALCLAPVQPSPLVPLEAMACGVPVVATRAGGNADTVLDGITGIHVPAGRPVQIGRAVRRLLTEDTTLNGYAIAAADRAHSRFSWDRIAAETLRAYTKVLPPEPEPEAAAAAETGAGVEEPVLVG